MKLLGYEIRKVLPTSEEIRFDILEGAQENATKGLYLAQLELRHHELLLEQSEGRTDAEIKGYTDAIERDKKSIINWQTQLRAISYERQTSK